MGNTLNGTTPQNTYPSLIKIGDNGAADATLQRLSDGEGNDLPLLVSTTSVTNLGGGAASGCTAFGDSALIDNLTGTNNTAIGKSSLENNTVSNNTALGFEAAQLNTTGTGVTAIGYQSLKSNVDGDYNTAIGCQSLLDNIDGSTNTAVGYLTLANNIGGQSNSALGTFALELSLGSENTGIGYNSLGINAGGSNNTAVGSNSLASNTSGSNNTAIGKNTGGGISSGSNNTIIGANVSGLSSSLSGNIILANGSGTIRIQTDSSGTTSFLGNAITNFIPNTQNTDVVLTISSANQNTFCGAVLEVTGALTITFDGSIRDGFNISVVQKDANSTTFAVTGGLTLRNRQGHTKTFGQWSTVTLYNDYANNLILSGDTAA